MCEPGGFLDVEAALISSRLSFSRCFPWPPGTTQTIEILFVGAELALKPQSLCEAVAVAVLERLC